MTCRHCQRLLSPYLDEALSVSEKAQLVAHVAHCSYCGDVLRQLESNRMLLRALPEVKITTAMTRGLEERLQQLEAYEIKRARIFSWDTSLKSQASNPKLSWRNWGMVSVGTLATAAAAIFFYVSTIQSPAEVSAEEVVSSMTQLLEDLDPEDGTTILDEEVPEARMPDWHEDFDSWFSDDDDEHN
jgi:predicted anti-sigma-YlaC factor YlaD